MKNFVLLIDHDDSFTQLLAYTLEEALAMPVKIVNHKKISLEEIVLENPALLVLSPGPGNPNKADDFALGPQVFDLELPILGICLGHQALALAHGYAVARAPHAVHGYSEKLQLLPHPIWEGLSPAFRVMRYHSLSAQNPPADSTLKPIAFTQDGQTIMALAHESKPQLGLQFHPESLGTPEGVKLLGKIWDHLSLVKHHP